MKEAAFFKADEAQYRIKKKPGCPFGNPAFPHHKAGPEVFRPTLTGGLALSVRLFQETEKPTEELFPPTLLILEEAHESFARG